MTLQPPLQCFVGPRRGDLRQYLRCRLREPVGVQLPGQVQQQLLSLGLLGLIQAVQAGPSTVPIAFACPTLIRAAVAAACATSGWAASSCAWCRNPAASRFDSPPFRVNHDVVGVPVVLIDSWVASALASNTAANAVNRDANPRASWAHSKRSPRATWPASNPSRLPLIPSNTRLAGDP